MSIKSLNATSEMLVKASGSVDKRIASHLVNIANHINGVGNGDVSPANYFFSLLTSTSGLRKDAIGNWLMAYAGCSWNPEKKKFGRKKDFQYDERLATENPWYKFTPQKEFKPFDLEKALASLIKKATAALEDTEHQNEHKVDKTLLNKILALKDAEPLPSATTVEAKGEASPETTVAETPVKAPAVPKEAKSSTKKAPVKSVDIQPSMH